MNTPSISELRQISLSHAIMHNSPKSMFVVLSSCLLQLQSPKNYFTLDQKKEKNKTTTPSFYPQIYQLLVASSTLFLIFPSLLLLMPNLTHSCRRTSSFVYPCSVRKILLSCKYALASLPTLPITPVQALSRYFKIKAPERNVK